ncbi:hypothetical protein CRG98_011238 [Punica granatum]|uniref:Retrotransposon gag domain-containing protein n=1 Tax=Punica granatum TaxID=22663 RepID=A0A2I0KJ34_PUNGR|nr:hypothetical protein CRG98_011238 [Punica granatum]
MAEENQLTVFEGNTPPTPVHSPQPTMHAPPPLTSAGVPLAHHGAPLAHLPQQARHHRRGTRHHHLATLEGNITTLQNMVDLMAANMAEMMALLRGPNRASSSSTLSLARGPTVDPAPWVPPTHTSEGDIAAALAPTIIPVPTPHSTRTPVIHLVDFCHPQSTIPTAVSLPPMTIPVPDPVMFVPSLVSVPAPAIVYTAPPPMGFPASSAPVPGAYYSHLMGHKSTFSEMIIAGKQVDLGIKLGRLEGPAKKGEGESLRKTAVAATPTNGRKGNEASVNVVNLGHPGSQQYSVNFIPTPPATHAYASLTVHYQSQHPAQPFKPLPTPLSHIYRQLLAGNMIRPTVPDPSFIPANQDQSLHCEYHSGTLGHTTDNCWKLRQEVQKLIDAKKISFNAFRPPNVQANPLPNHESSSGPTINMISVCTMREDESQQEGPAPFVIEYVLAEAIVGFTGSSAASAPFIIEVPAREPVMGVTRSGRVYTNSEIAGKGKAPATSGAALEASPIPQKKVTEEEAETFMKVIKASEYKLSKFDSLSRDAATREGQGTRFSDDGTKDPRHHLRHYHGKMLQYWDYEQFVIATFQESLSGPALNWFISLRAEHIPSWTELARKFVEQY